MADHLLSFVNLGSTCAPQHWMLFGHGRKNAVRRVLSYCKFSKQELQRSQMTVWWRKNDWSRSLYIWDTVSHTSWSGNTSQLERNRFNVTWFSPSKLTSNIFFSSSSKPFSNKTSTADVVSLIGDNVHPSILPLLPWVCLNAYPSSDRHISTTERQNVNDGYYVANTQSFYHRYQCLHLIL